MKKKAYEKKKKKTEIEKMLQLQSKLRKKKGINPFTFY